MAADNKTLGRFILDGIAPAPRGIPQVEVKFDIDANGILNVSAKEKASGKEQSIRIEASTSLSKEEVERLKQEAQAHADEDKKKREMAEARNMAESLVYTSEKSLADAGDKAPAELKSSLEEKIKKLKEVKDGSDVEAIKSATNELSSELSKLGPSMTSDSAKPEEEKAQDAEGPSDDNSGSDNQTTQ